MSFLPRLFRSVLPSSQPSIIPSPSSRPISSFINALAGPSRIQHYSTVKKQLKQKTNKAAAARFKMLKGGVIMRRRACASHGNTMWAVGRLARLSAPTPVHSKAMRKTIKRMLPYNNR